MNLTVDQLVRAAGTDPVTAGRWLAPLTDAMTEFGIDSPRAVAHFLAQIGHESGGLKRVEENLNYRVTVLMSLFGRHRISSLDAQTFGRDDARGQKANPEAIANRIYGGEFGAKNLGNTEAGDGWKFRGRGPKQITGRANYRDCGEALGLPLLDDPDLLLQPVHGARAAAWFWSSRRITPVAERGDVEAVTRLINGGVIGLDDRMRRTQLAMAAMGVA